MSSTFDSLTGPYIVAEIGVNHNGDLELAKRTVDAAVRAGADCVKFQTFRAEEFMADPELIYEYKSAGETVRESMFAMFKRLELPEPWHGQLLDHARARGVDFLSSAADPVSVNLLARLGVPALKIASEDLINLPLLEHVSRAGLPVLLSTGMGDEAEIDHAVGILRGAVPELMLLHCVSLYPTPDDQAHLNRIVALRERFDLPVGYSDHSRGIEAAVAAVALGARVIEKHFTLDRTLPGPDHALSADPEELAALVRSCRRVAAMSGAISLDPSPGELQARRDFRRSIVAARDLPPGTMLEKTHLALRRPGTGLHPHRLGDVAGRRLARELRENEQLRWEDLVDEPD